MRNTFWNASAVYEKKKNLFEAQGRLSYIVEKCTTVTPVSATMMIDKFLAAHQAKSSKHATTTAGLQSKRERHALPELTKMLQSMSSSLQVSITSKSGLHLNIPKSILVEPSSSPDHSTASDNLVSASEASTIDDIIFQEMPSALMQYGLLTPSSSSSNVVEETESEGAGFKASKKRKYVEESDDESEEEESEEEEEEDEKPKKKKK